MNDMTEYIGETIVDADYWDENGLTIEFKSGKKIEVYATVEGKLEIVEVFET